MTRLPTRRIQRLVPLIAGGMAVALLAGCSNSSDAADSSGSAAATGGGGGGSAATSFKLVAPSSGAGESSYQKIAADYEAATGIHVDVEMVPADGYDQTVTTELQAGSAADALVVTGGTLFPTSVGPLVAAGMLAPITNESAKSTLTDQTASLFEGSDGTLYGQPTGTLVYGLITNTMTLKSTGLDFPTSLEEMTKDCTTLGGKPSFLAVAGTAANSTSMVVASLATDAVYVENPNWNQDRTDGKVTFATSDGWKKVYQQMSDLVKAGCFQEGAAGAGFPDLVGALMGGGSVAINLPSLLVNEIAAQAAAGGGAAPSGAPSGAMPSGPMPSGAPSGEMPSGAASGAAPPAGMQLPLEVNAFPPASGDKSLVVAQPGAGIGINSTSAEDKQAAVAAFLDWLAQPENNATFAGYEGSIPAANMADPSTYPPAFAPVASQLASGEYTYLPSSTFPSPAVSQAMGDGLTALLTGQGDMDSWLASMDTAWGQ